MSDKWIFWTEIWETSRCHQILVTVGTKSGTKQGKSVKSGDSWCHPLPLLSACQVSPFLEEGEGCERVLPPLVVTTLFLPVSLINGFRF